MDTSTVTFICGVIACLIGVATFIVGMLQRAKQDGATSQMLNQALKGIEEIKVELKSYRNEQNDLTLKVNLHEEKIKQISETISEIKRKQEE
jgi:septal ring factor EnvC (AmiA/AmiB activator)